MTSLQQGAVKAGLIIGAGLLIVRASMGRDIPLAVGFTLFEIGGVLFLESKAKKLDQEIAEWRKAQDAWELSQAAGEELDRRRGLVREIEESISGIEEEMRARLRNSDPDSAKAFAVAQARAGYLAGIAENRAAGVVPREAL